LMDDFHLQITNPQTGEGTTAFNFYFILLELFITPSLTYDVEAGCVYT